MNENNQPGYDIEKYEQYLKIQADKVLTSFEERVHIILLNYPQYTHEQVLEMDEADAVELAKAAIRRECERTLSLLSVIAAAQNKDAYKKMYSSLTKTIRGLRSSYPSRREVLTYPRLALYVSTISPALAIVLTDPR